MSILQQAVQDEGFEYDSSWMPWKAEKDAPPGAFGDRQFAADLEDARAACPGVLLFRKRLVGKDQAASAYSQGLAVFIVGEQATGGINQDQWDNTVAEFDRLLKGSAPKSQSTRFLRVLGPTFTGSLRSLERDLKAALSDRRMAKEFPAGARVLSGSVTSCAEIQRFDTDSRKLPKKVTFGTFQENDALHIFRFLDYIAGQGTAANDVAILSEDETAYAALPSDPTADDGCDFRYPHDNRPMHLTYPRDISALRDAYEKESVFDSGNGLKEHAAHPILRDIAGSETAIDEITDTIPAYSGSVSAVAQEAYLYGVVSFLRTHHARYLVLRCTNPLDFLFLTRFFHRAYPEARIVTIGSDMLFRREIDTTEFRGVLSLSSYPLLPRGQHWAKITEADWEKEPHEHLVFESHLSEGTYIAARYLLQEDTGAGSNDAQSPVELARAFPTPDYAAPFWSMPARETPDLAQPDTWLTVVGRDGYWPLAVLGIPEGQSSGEQHFYTKGLVKMLEMLPFPHKQHLEQKGAKPPPPTPVQLSKGDSQHYEEPSGNHNLLISQPLPWLVAVMFSTCLSFYQIWGMVRGNRRSSDGIFSVFRKAKDGSLTLLQSVSCALAVMPLIELTFVRFIPRDVNRVSSQPGSLRLWSYFAVILVLAMAATLFRRWISQGKWLIAALGCYFFALASFCAIYGYAFAMQLDETTAVPLFYRMSHLTDGVSPLVPILLLTAGFYLWAWQAMAGNLIVAKGCPTLPEADSQSKPRSKKQFSKPWYSLKGLKQRYRKLRGSTYYKLIGYAAAARRGACLLPPSASRVSQALGKRILKIAHPVSITLKIAIVPVLLILAALLCFGFKNLPLLSLEGKSFNLVINLTLLFALVLTSAEAARMYWTWIRLRKLLHALARLRLRRTLAQLRPIEANSIWAVSGNVRRFQYGLFVRQFEAANRFLQLPLAASGIQPQLEELKTYGSAFIERTEKAVDAGAAFDVHVTSPGHAPADIRNMLSDEAAHMYRFLSEVWQRETESLDLTTSGSDTEGEDKKCPALPLSKCEKVKAAEEFLSYHYIAFIQNIIARMRTMTLSMTFLFVAVCFAISFYPFVPRTEIAVWMMLNLALIGGAVAYVYAGMERDEILSYIANSKPGQLGAEFWLKLGGFLIGPVIGIITTQFPAIADTVLQSLQPGLDAIK